MSKRLPISSTWLILATIVILIMIVEAVVIHRIYATQYPGTADFFARWYGAKELVLRQRNPYTREIELEAQYAMFGRYTEPHEDQVNFAYPLYTVFLFWPLTLTDYAWAQAIWMVVLQFSLMGMAMMLFGIVRWRPPPWLFVLTIFWSIFFYPGARAIMLGQFSVIVALGLLVCVWALLNGYDILAGLVLPLTTVKPQMVFLIIPFLLLWAWRQKRWRFIISSAGGMAFLFLASVIWVPNWPLLFVQTLSAYSDYVGFGSPLENMTARFTPGFDTVLNPVITVILAGFLLWQWWQVLTKSPEKFLWALSWTLLISSLIAFRSATANHVILFLPMFLVFKRLARAPWQVVTVQIGGSLLLWVLFLTTIDTSRGSNFEAVFMHGFLPTLLILLFFIDGTRLKTSTPDLKVSS
ncbi:MAG: glycosyltransferase 87 family protein [Chloroflexota bacterium]